MRNQGAWSLSAVGGSDADAIRIADEAELAVLAWIDGKRDSSVAANDDTIVLRDGRPATLTEERVETDVGRLYRMRIAEQPRDVPFETVVCLTRLGRRIDVYAEMRAAQTDPLGQSMAIETRCPRVVRSLVEQQAWHYGTLKLFDRPEVFTGGGDAARLDSLLFDPERSLPVVLVSECDGDGLAAGFADALARDVCGVGLVATLDREAASALSRRRGAEWSCYNGAVRLFWPITIDDDPLRHPLWTLESILASLSTVDRASHFLRQAIRRRLMNEAALVNREPSAATEIRRAAFARVAASADTDPAIWQSLAEEQEASISQLSRSAETLQQRCEELEQENRALAWRLRAQEENAPDPFGDDVVEERFPPPETVAEAVRYVRELPGARVRFGADVDASIATLLETAGPPNKVLRYLLHLDRLARRLDEGPLGLSVAKWLVEQGAATTTDSETVKNAATEKKKRTFDAGGEPVCFDLHMKPSDGTQPNRCVRIYFLVEESSNDIIVGYLGVHL